MLKKALAVSALLMVGVIGAKAQTDTLTLATAGRTFFNYLPVTLAEKIGAFSEQNLKVTINDFQGGSKSIEALVGGSTDMVVATYENTILLQTKGVSLTAVTLINYSLGAVIGIQQRYAQTRKNPADMKGLTFGVTSAGSALQRILLTYLGKGGLKLDDVGVVGIGGGASAVAALQAKRVDGFVHVDPVLTEALKTGDWYVLVDTRTEKGMEYIFGGNIAATAVVTTPAYLKKNPRAAQKFVNAMVRTLKWMTTAPLDVVLAAVPPDFYKDKEDYRRALAAQIKLYSADGVLQPDVIERTYKSMVNEGLVSASQKVSLEDSYTNDLARRAK